MQLRAKITVSAEVTITDAQAEILAHMCSYGIAKVFAEKFSGKYTAEQIETTLRALGTTASKLVEAREAAADAVSSINKT